MKHKQSDTEVIIDRYIDPYIQKLITEKRRRKGSFRPYANRLDIKIDNGYITVPPGYRVACHICNPTEYFLDMEGCMEHKKLVHDLKG